MAVYKRDMVDINLETGNIHRSFLKHSIGYKDAAADHFGIRVFRNGEPVSLTGVSVQGIFMPPQGSPIAITSGNIVSENEAEVVLPQACYNYDGQFTLSIKLVDATNAVTGTMRIVDGMVDNTHASGTVAPTDTIPTYQEILAVYAQLLEDVTDYESVVATQDAKIDDLKSAMMQQNVYSATDDIRNVTEFTYGTTESNSASVMKFIYSSKRIRPLDFIFVKAGDRINIKNRGYAKLGYWFHGWTGTPDHATHYGSNSPSMVTVEDSYVNITRNGFVCFIFADKTNTSNDVNLSDMDCTITIINDLDMQTPATNTSLNDLTTVGKYFLYQDRTFTNIPSAFTGTSGVLIVSKESSICCQTLYGLKQGAVYTRYKGSSWTDWFWMPSMIASMLVTNTDMNDVTTPGVYSLMSDYTFTNLPSKYINTPGLLIVTKDSSVIYQTLIGLKQGTIYTRYKGTYWTDWSSDTDSKEISILFVGNSLTQDGIAYLPYMLKTYYPEVHFKFYIYYNDANTLAMQYQHFTNDDACNIFSVAEDTAIWTNTNNSVQMSSILTTYKFDIVCMQDYYQRKASQDAPYDVPTLTDWNNCRDYIVSNYTGGNALEFISLFHAPVRNDVENVYQLTKNGNASILQNTISEDMIPIGMAVYRALSTDLDDLGDQGHLSPDGTHTQEGLPCLLQTFTALCWLFDKLAINKSVYGSSARITQDICNTIHPPGGNYGTGVITGTDAQNLLAQEVAIKAYKEGKKFVADNLFAEES